MRSNGMLLTIYDPSFFCEDEKYDLELESLISHVLGSRIDPAVGRIRLPGSPEFDTARDRNRDGIPVDDTTWNRILERARRLGLDTQDWTQAAIAP